MIDQLDTLLQWFDKLQTLPAAGLVFILCIAVGYGWRALNFKWFPNEAIPIVVMLIGAIFMMLIADGKPTTMPHHVWTARNLAIGFIIGAVAWVAHNYVIAKFIEPWIASKTSKAQPDPTGQQPPQAPK